MDKSPDAFRSIGEVARLVGVAPHVLRYWETQFTQLSPVKRGDGRRYYRPDDVRLVAGLCQVMREEGLSIRGAKRMISADRGLSLRRIGETRLGDAMGEHLNPRDETPTLPAAAVESSTEPLPRAESGPVFTPPEAGAAPDPWFARLASLAAALRQMEDTGAAPAEGLAALHLRLGRALAAV
ncbi:MerR family transcriptional regulator [Paracoccus ravus]|uniref:MerR family transcriptional regulator n=1 Tax=Paracoccus ravus TaxID=2447760 RepID=UPI00106E7695|nr:MerR family transcriptional regulator [Paracoccus ravus]